MAGDGTLHMIVDFYEGEDDAGRGLHQATCYLRSGDRGESWQAADGRPAPSGARPADLSVLAQGTFSRHEPLPPPETKHGGIVATAEGRPVFFRLHHSEAAGRVYVGTVDDAGVVRERVISDSWESVWPQMRANGCWSSIRDDGVIFALILLTPHDAKWADGRLPTRDRR